jgi:hypothetical protein
MIKSTIDVCFTHHPHYQDQLTILATLEPTSAEYTMNVFTTHLPANAYKALIIVASDIYTVRISYSSLWCGWIQTFSNRGIINIHRGTRTIIYELTVF